MMLLLPDAPIPTLLFRRSTISILANQRFNVTSHLQITDVSPECLSDAWTLR